MNIRRLLRTATVILGGCFIAISTYVAVYAFMLGGMAATTEIDPVQGIKTLRVVPVYHRPEFVSREWTQTIERGFAPAHYLDTFVRSERWKARVAVLSPEVLKEIRDEIAAEIAAEVGENQRN